MQDVRRVDAFHTGYHEERTEPCPAECALAGDPEEKFA